MLHQQEPNIQNQHINVNIDTMTQNTTENLENYQDMEEESFNSEYEHYWQRQILSEMNYNNDIEISSESDSVELDETNIVLNRTNEQYENR